MSGLADEPHQFSQVVVVVPTKKEAGRVLDKLKELHDAGSHNYDYAYNRTTLENTFVVALDEVEVAVSADKLLTIRLDDLPTSTIQKFARPAVSPAFVAGVKSALAEAHKAAASAASECIAQRMNADGDVLDACGFAHLMLYSPQSPVATALIELGEATVIGGVGYWVSNFSQHAQGCQALCVKEAAVEGARAVMERYFPDAAFGLESSLD
ncbi:MAG: hypothetical protein P4L76_15350 [Beijerinckiaceae bacterium]|nr:hypothetical protein [Beijerinckiaceae bacterium]